MESLILIMTGITFFGFVFGLAGKSRAIKKKSMKKNIFYQNITVVSLILMILSAIIYSLIS